jgi:hypothetical protein
VIDTTATTLKTAITLTLRVILTREDADLDILSTSVDANGAAAASVSTVRPAGVAVYHQEEVTKSD